MFSNCVTTQQLSAALEKRKPVPNGKKVAITIGGLTALIEKYAALELQHGSPPAKIDYRKYSNPYQQKYDPDNTNPEKWLEAIRNAPNLRKFCCVTDLVEHVMRVAIDYFKDTKFENNWFLYHDALSLMTAIDCQAWMQEKGYLKHWILPELGLNQGIGTFGIWKASSWSQSRVYANGCFVEQGCA